MDKSILKKSAVVFDEKAHKYWLGDKELSGITSLLHRTAFADMYKGVSSSVLNRAADRGSNIHYEISMWISAGIEPESTEGKNFVSKIVPWLNLVASEYIVSDEKHVASAIDIVAATDDTTVHLLDIKSYKDGLKKDKKEYVRWQLSCYALLFERQNPGLKVGRISCLWLSGDHAEIIDVDRVDDKDILAMIDADANGLPYIRPDLAAVANVDTDAMVRYRSFEDEFIKLDARIKELKALKDAALEEVKAALEKAGATSVETEGLKFTLVPATTTTRFDSTKFKAEQPELYTKYTKTSDVKSYVKVSAR